VEWILAGEERDQCNASVNTEMNFLEIGNFFCKALFRADQLKGHISLFFKTFK
jgi:hypothetical protein